MRQASFELTFPMLHTVPPKVLGTHIKDIRAPGRIGACPRPRPETTTAAPAVISLCPLGTISPAPIKPISPGTSRISFFLFFTKAARSGIFRSVQKSTKLYSLPLGGTRWDKMKKDEKR